MRRAALLSGRVALRGAAISALAGIAGAFLFFLQELMR